MSGSADKLVWTLKIIIMKLEDFYGWHSGIPRRYIVYIIFCMPRQCLKSGLFFILLFVRKGDPRRGE